MKKLLLLTLVFLSGYFSNAQTVTLSIVTPPCDSNGVVVATVTGLTGTLYYWWNHEGNIVSHYGVSSLTDTLYGFPGGGISIYASQGSSLWAYDTITSLLPFAISASSTPGVCPSSPQLNASITGGGTAPFTYQWSDSSTSAIVSTANPANVPGGNYYLKVIDAAGCISGIMTPVSAVSSATFSISATATAAICPAPGSATITISGSGTSPYTYSWQNPSTGAIASTSNPATLSPGTYYVMVTDATGCELATNTYVALHSDFTAVVSTTTANCTDGTASTTITGGTAPFSYLWSNGATTPSISGLVMGNYSVGITDASGCVNDSTLTGYVPQSIYISVNELITPPTCINSDGSIIALPSGGVPPYTYLWSNGAVTPTITGISAGSYDITVTDANGCLGSGWGYANSSTPITVTYATTASSCTSPTGTASLTVGGGTVPYNITWHTTPVQTGATATALPPGNYYFDIVDALGCIRTGTVTVPPVDVISLSLSAISATCTASDGSVSVSASSGVSPYTYLWSTGSTSATVTTIPAGNYHVTVTDAHGCTAVGSKYVPYTSPLTLGLSSTPASCLYVSDGSITATAAMGTAPYTFSMGGSSSGTVTIPGLATNPYWISVTDAIGCTAAQYAYVDYNVSDSSCFCVVKGTVYDDANHNCIQDAGEAGIDHIQMHCSGLGYTYTDASGDYYFLVPSGTYTVSQTILGMYPLSPCQPNNIPVTSVAATGCYTTINFADTLNPIHDMHISTWDYTPARPGFAYTQATIVTNDGTITEPNIFTGYKPDGQIFGPSFVPSGVFTGAPYYYSTSGSFPSLAPGAGQSFLINYTVPADVPLGTSVLFTDTAAYAPPVSNWLSDYSPWNNVNYFTTVTVGSYDPNFKEVSPKGVGGSGVITNNDSVLEYMVHFQNTGSYMAENVVVRDTLSANLDWKTLRPVYSSKKCVVDIDESGRVTFIFDHIDLPPSSSEPVASNAMFTYTIKQRPGLDTGAQIKNSASIYFDFNAPIKTNTTKNTINDATAVPTTPAGNLEHGAFTIYPNPANNTFNAIITSKEGGAYSLKVSDVAGKTQLSKSLSLQKGSQTVTVDVAHLTAGIYFVTLSGSDGKNETQKLVIMK